MKNCMLKSLGFVFVLGVGYMSISTTAIADTFGSGANSFEIEFVAIGDPGNAGDPTGSPVLAGAVDYNYRIGKYEISEEMINNANLQSAAEGQPLNITIDSRGPNKPATSVSWFEAAQFVNWLNTSKGNTPAYKFDDQGEFQLWEETDAGFDPDNLFRNKRAKYVLPSSDEWYKAAYYDPAGDVYFDYPTGSDDVPDGIDFVGDTSFDAVFWDGVGNLQPNDITDVGLLSPYGTAGQGGNIFEWEETERDLKNDSNSSRRGIRGGFWRRDSRLLLSSLRISGDPAREDNIDSERGNNNVGFRVASIPEPSTLLLLCVGTLGTLGLRMRSTAQNILRMNSN